MRTLVIGGSGLISTSVTQQLIDRGDDVALLNRGKTAVRFRGETELLVGDRTVHPAFERLIREAGPWDCVIDMICSAPDDARALAVACRERTGQVIFCSTTNVYCKPADSYPVGESHRLGATFKNGIDKAECERIHRAAEAEGFFAVTLVRPGHTYGESGGVLHSLGNATSYLDRIRHGRPVVVHGDGNGLWSALHADDVARVFVAAAGTPAAFGQTYNATGTEWVTWDRYTVTVAEAMGCAPPELLHIPLPQLIALAPERSAQVQRSLQYPGLYDTTKAREELGFTQQISLVEGMRRTIQWLEANAAIDAWPSDVDYERIVGEWQRALG